VTPEIAESLGLRSPTGALVASVVPAIRVLRLDPALTLRAE